jgi:hypothetical protein
LFEQLSDPAGVIVGESLPEQLVRVDGLDCFGINVGIWHDRSWLGIRGVPNAAVSKQTKAGLSIAPIHVKSAPRTRWISPPWHASQLNPGQLLSLLRGHL